MHKAKRILLGTTAIVAAGAAGIALAQTYPPAYLTNFSWSADAVRVVPGGAGTVPDAFVHPGALSATVGYQKVAQTLTSNALTVTATNLNSYILFYSGTGGTGGTITINFPQLPSDGQKFCIRSVNGIVAGGTTLAYGLTGSNSSITFRAAGPTGLAAATDYCWLYSASDTTWDLI
jgi:hypothetical protein